MFSGEEPGRAGQGAPVGSPSARRKIGSPRTIKVQEKTEDKGVSLTVE